MNISTARRILRLSTFLSNTFNNNIVFCPMVSIHYLSMFDPIVSLPLSLVNLSSSDPEHVVTCNVTAGHFNHCFSWIAFDKFDYLSDNASPCSLTCPIWDNLGIQAIASNQLCTCSLFVACHLSTVERMSLKKCFGFEGYRNFSFKVS